MFFSNIKYKHQLSYQLWITISENGSYRPDTADEEVYMIQRGGGDRSPAPSLAVTEGDYGASAENDITCRSTLQRYIFHVSYLRACVFLFALMFNIGFLLLRK